jgi:hypothetical protein
MEGLRELDEREIDNHLVKKLWKEEGNRIVVDVHSLVNFETEPFRLETTPEFQHEAYMHPMYYAAAAGRVVLEEMFEPLPAFEEAA